MIPTILHSEKGKTLETKVIYSRQESEGGVAGQEDHRRFLGQWNYSVRYNGEYMSLYIAITQRMYNTKCVPKCWLWTLSDYVVFIKCTTWTTQVGDIDNSCVETGCI